MALPPELLRHLELNGNEDIVKFAKDTWQQLESHAAQGPDQYRYVSLQHSLLCSELKGRGTNKFLACLAQCRTQSQDQQTACSNMRTIQTKKSKCRTVRPQFADYVEEYTSQIGDI